MPAAIPEAKRPDEPPEITIQTTISSKITDTSAVISRAAVHCPLCTRARSTSPADIAQQHSLIA